MREDNILPYQRIITAPYKITPARYRRGKIREDNILPYKKEKIPCITQTISAPQFFLVGADVLDGPLQKKKIPTRATRAQTDFILQITKKQTVAFATVCRFCFDLL